MPEEYRVFVASPGDVQWERDPIENAVEEVNELQGEERG